MDSVPWAIAAVVPGLLLIPLALHLINFAGVVSATFTRALLGWTPVTVTPGVPANPGAVDRAATAAFTWDGVRIGRLMSAEASRVQSVQVRLWTGHVLFFAGLSTILVVLNGLTTPSAWWAIWPIWGLGIACAAHTDYFLRGFLGAHALVFAVVNLGLFVIDSNYSNTSWFFWPLLGWGIALGLHAYAVFAYTGARPSDYAFEAAPVAPPAAAVAPHPPRLAAALVAPAPVAEPPSPPTPAAPAFETTPALPARAEGPLQPAIAVDVEMRIVTVAGQLVEVTPKEFDLLALFSTNPGRPFSREDCSTASGRTTTK